MAISAESASIFSRVIQPEHGSLPADLAHYVLELDFRPEDHARYEELSAKAQDGTLTPQESEALDGYLHVDSLLSIMRLKANRSLKGDSDASK